MFFILSTRISLDNQKYTGIYSTDIHCLLHIRDSVRPQGVGELVEHDTCLQVDFRRVRVVKCTQLTILLVLWYLSCCTFTIKYADSSKEYFFKNNWVMIMAKVLYFFTPKKCEVCIILV